MHLIDMLKRHEGFRQFVYRDTVGIPTIGYGRNLVTVGIREEEATILLENDVLRVRAQLVNFAWFTTLDEVRQAAIVDMSVNMGVAGVLNFTHMIDALQERAWPRAADAALVSKWAKQVGARAVEIALMLRTGEWQKDG